MAELSDSSSNNGITLRAKKILQLAAMLLFLILQEITSAKAAFAKLCKLLLGTNVVLSSLVCAPIMLLLPTAGN